MKLLRLINLPNLYFDINQIATENQSFSSFELLNYCYDIGAVVPKNFTPAMKLLGWDCIDILVHKPFLVRWCKEHAVPFQTYDQVLKSIITLYKPDFLYVERCYLSLISPDFRKELKAKFSFLKGIVLWIGNQIDDSELTTFKEYDVIFNITPGQTEQFKKFISNSYCVRAGGDILPHSIENKEQLARKYLFTFAGSSGYNMFDHTNRLCSLKFLLNQTPLQAWVNEPRTYTKKLYHHEAFIWEMFNQPIKKIIKFLKRRKYSDLRPYFFRILAGTHPEIVYNSWKKEAPVHHQFKKNIFEALYGQKYYQLLKDSQITLNLHCDQPGHGGNFRVFEAATAATCLLTDRAHLMKDFIDPEKDVVGFESNEEALEKFNYLKDKPALCHEIGMNLHQKILSKHTIYHRCQDIIKCLENYLEQKG